MDKDLAESTFDRIRKELKKLKQKHISGGLNLDEKKDFILLNE